MASPRVSEEGPKKAPRSENGHRGSPLQPHTQGHSQSVRQTSSFWRLRQRRWEGQLREEQTDQYFDFLISHGLGEMPEYKKLRLGGVGFDEVRQGVESIREAERHAEEQNRKMQEAADMTEAEGGNEDGDGNTMPAEEGEARREPTSETELPGFFWTQGRREYWIPTVKPCSNEADDDDNDGDDRRSAFSARKDQMPFPDWAQMRIDSVNLTVCGAGLDGVSCMHARARMKKLRDEWSNSDDPQQREAATKFSERLEAADLAQKLVQRGSLHSLDKTVFQDRVKTLVSTNMVFPSALAREITDRHVSDMMQPLLKGTLDTRTVCAAFFPYDIDELAAEPVDQDTLAVDERGRKEWDPFNPRGCDIPVLPELLAESFERSSPPAA
eukprot:955362-Pyramimonas_sp.AAC.1